MELCASETGAALREGERSMGEGVGERSLEGEEEAGGRRERIHRQTRVVTHRMTWKGSSTKTRRGRKVTM